MNSIFTVAFRFPDGETVAQHRWSEGWNWWLHHPRMFRGDREFVDAYLALADPDSCEDVCDVCPYSGGLLVFDYLTGHVVSMQSFASFGQFSAKKLMHALTWSKRKPLHASQFRELLGAGAILIETIDAEGRVTDSVPSNLPDESLLGKRAFAVMKADEELCLGLETMEDLMNRSERIFRILPKPLKLLEFAHWDKTGVSECKSMLEKAGFDLSSCLTEWAEYGEKPPIA